MPDGASGPHRAGFQHYAENKASLWLLDAAQLYDNHLVTVKVLILA